MKKQQARRQLILKAVMSVAIVVVIGAGIALILASPLILRDAAGGVSWTRLSEISSTYAAASAILSGLGVGAVAIALLIQARQAKAERIDAVYGIHRQLLMATIGDMETYAPCWGPFAADVATRRQLFTVQILNYYWQGYDVGVISELELRKEALPFLFSGQVGRDVWTQVRPDWDAGIGSKAREFLPIVDEEFMKAKALGPAKSSQYREDGPSQQLTIRRARPNRWIRPDFSSFAAGFLCAAFLYRPQHRRLLASRTQGPLKFSEIAGPGLPWQTLPTRKS